MMYLYKIKKKIHMPIGCISINGLIQIMNYNALIYKINLTLYKLKLLNHCYDKKGTDYIILTDKGDFISDEEEIKKYKITKINMII